jgi:hypothetical protein
MLLINLKKVVTGSNGAKPFYDQKIEPSISDTWYNDNLSNDSSPKDKWSQYICTYLRTTSRTLVGFKINKIRIEKCVAFQGLSK